MPQTRPIPEHPERLPLAHEVDDVFRSIREFFFLRSPEDVWIFLRTNGILEDVRRQNKGDDACFNLMKSSASPALLETIRAARSAIALHIGESPAAFHRFLPDYYDPDFLRIYRYSFTVRCKHHRRNCVRPSHLIICTLDDRPLREHRLD